jgi:transposase-like protein
MEVDTNMDKKSMVVAGEPVRVTRNGRRYYSKAHQEAVVAKCLVPGASLAAVALANGFNANLVRRWVRVRQARHTLAHAAPRLLPVTIQPEQARVLPERAVSRRSRARINHADRGSMKLRVGSIELVLHGTVDREQLSLVLETLLRAQ